METVLKDKMFTAYQVGYQLEYEDQVWIITGFHCIHEFINELRRLSFELNCTFVLVSFNGSWFDDILLMWYLMNTGDYWVDGVFKNNSILGLKIQGFIKCWDLSRFLVGSLKKNANDFKTKTRKVDGYSHFYIQNKYEELGNDEFIKFIQNDESATEYLQCDV